MTLDEAAAQGEDHLAEGRGVDVMRAACELYDHSAHCGDWQEDVMRTLWLVVWLIAAATAFMVWSAVPVNAQEVDQGPVQCRDFPFPFSVLCLANKASYQPEKICHEIGQLSVKPAGQQCDAGRAERPAVARSREPKGRECSHSYGSKPQ